MNLSVLLVFCLATPIVVDPPAESIAVVDLRECLLHAPTSKSDRDGMVNDIEETDTEARYRHEILKRAEAKSKLEGATALDIAGARILKLEFDEFRRREQARLKNAEQDMFQKWHDHVDAAVNRVAERDGFTIVLYVGRDEGDTNIALGELQQMLTKTHAAYVIRQQRTNITAKVVAEMSSDAFRKTINDAVESEQHNAAERCSVAF